MPSRRPAGPRNRVPSGEPDDAGGRFSLAAASSSSSSGSPSSPPFLPLSLSSSLSSSAASTSDPPPPRRSGRALKSGWEPQERRLPKSYSSEPALFTRTDFTGPDTDVEKGSLRTSDSVHRRCVTSTDFDSVHGWPSQAAAPDLLQLFAIFQFNEPEKPLARMLINVTLVGNIQPVRLLVAYDASVQDVIRASLKAYVKEGRLPKNIIKIRNYGLHYSPFCLESIDPTEHISTLGTRSFFLFPSSIELTNPREGSEKMKQWWNIFRSMLL